MRFYAFAAQFTNEIYPKESSCLFGPLRALCLRFHAFWSLCVHDDLLDVAWFCVCVSWVFRWRGMKVSWGLVDVRVRWET